MRVPARDQRKLSGFTLVEMAIVLVIIGIILAGVMKGRDIVRSAQMKEFAQSFGNKWVTLTQTYYDKTGQHLTDGTANAGTDANPDGYMDGIAADVDDADAVLAIMQSAGVDPCNNVKTINTTAIGGGTTARLCSAAKNPFLYDADSEFLGQVTIVVNWGAIYDNTDLRVKNVVSFSNCPIEFAKALDTLVDGEANGAAGFALTDVASLSHGIFTAGTPLTSVFAGGAAAGAGTPPAIAMTPTALPVYQAGVDEVTEIVVAMDY